MTRREVRSAISGALKFKERATRHPEGFCGHTAVDSSGNSARGAPIARLPTLAAAGICTPLHYDVSMTHASTPCAGPNSRLL